MKLNEKTKMNTVTNTPEEPRTIPEWWATLSHDQNMLAFTIFQLMKELNEKKDRRMEIRLDHGKIKVSLTTPLGGTLEVDDVVSFQKPHESKKVKPCSKIETWFKTLMESEPEIAAQVREAVLGNQSKYRWN